MAHNSELLKTPAERIERLKQENFNRFLLKICPFGYGDIYKALEILSGIYHESETADKLADLFHESLESDFFTDYDSVDLCYLAINHTLEKAQGILNRLGYNIDLNELLDPYYDSKASFFNCESDSTLADALEIAVDYDNMELLQAIVKGEIKLRKKA
mgnify:CR=1 FL=1